MSRARVEYSDGNQLKLSKPSQAGLRSLLKSLADEASNVRPPGDDNSVRPPRGYGRDSLLVALVEPMTGHVGRVLSVRATVEGAIESYFLQHFHGPDGCAAGGPRSIVIVGCAVMAGSLVSLSGQIVIRK